MIRSLPLLRATGLPLPPQTVSHCYCFLPRSSYLNFRKVEPICPLSSSVRMSLREKEGHTEKTSHLLGPPHTPQAPGTAHKLPLSSQHSCKVLSPFFRERNQDSARRVFLKATQPGRGQAGTHTVLSDSKIRSNCPFCRHRTRWIRLGWGLGLQTPCKWMLYLLGAFS